MPWIEAMLRGQRVLARADQSGALVAEAGRVEVRYKPKDGRAYRAASGNLVIPPGAKLLPDDACAPAEPAAPREGADAKGPAKKASASKAAKAKAANAPTASADAWIAYTDGACSGNPGPAGAGFILVSPGGQTVKEGYEFLGESTNNVGELTGILRALESSPANAAILVHTDSKYAIGVLTQNWKAKANQELIARTKQAMVGRDVVIAYVPAHSGIPMNERADELAREAISMRRSKLLPRLA